MFNHLESLVCSTLLLKIARNNHSKELKSEKRSNIEMIEHQNSKITLLTGEIKLLQSDQETSKYTIYILYLNFHDEIHQILIYLVKVIVRKQNSVNAIKTVSMRK